MEYTSSDFGEASRFKRQEAFLPSIYQSGLGGDRGFREVEIIALKELYRRSGGYPSKQESKRLMRCFSLSKEKVYRWFYNRRARGGV